MIKGKAVICDSPAGLSVGYEDLDVEFFGGADYEVTYTLDRNSAEKLRRCLKNEVPEGTLEEMILERFGPYLDREPFGSYCEERGIAFDLFTWVS